MPDEANPPRPRPPLPFLIERGRQMCEWAAATQADAKQVVAAAQAAQRRAGEACATARRRLAALKVRQPRGPGWAPGTG